MYAVIKSGGKQYRVEEGQTLKLEKLEVATGETINFDLGAARVIFEQAMHRSADGALLAGAKVQVACLAADSFKAVRLPAWIRQKMVENMEQET